MRERQQGEKEIKSGKHENAFPPRNVTTREADFLDGSILAEINAIFAGLILARQVLTHQGNSRKRLGSRRRSLAPAAAVPAL